MPDHCDLLCLDLPKAEALRRGRVAAGLASAAAKRAKALGDPTRLTIVAALRDGGELCVCDISWVCERPQSLISHHVRVLRVAGLVTSRRDGKMVLYSLSAEGRAMADAVLTAVEVPA